MIRISRNAMDAVRAHCEEEYPDECCGVVLSLPDGNVRAMRIRNIQDEMHAKDPIVYPRTARTAYIGHPADLRAALELGQAQGCSLVAFYHSHPDHDAYFSAEDTAQATPFGEPSYPDAVQLVLSVIRGRVRIAKAFAWSSEAGSYAETPLEEE